MHVKHRNTPIRLKWLPQLFAAGIILFSLVSCAASPGSSTPKADGMSSSAYTYTQTNCLSSASDTPKDMELAALSDGMALYLDPVSTRFAVRDRQGRLWYSSVSEEEADQDETAYGDYRRALTSLITVKACDSHGESAKEYASSRYSVRDGDYTVRYLLDEQGTQFGFRIDFTFTDLSLTVPLTVGLRDGRLFAEILTHEIENSDPDTVILEIGLLPHFGSASQEDSGYMLVPDGCGGIIRMNNGAVSSGGFEMPVYGTDAAYVKARQAGNEEKALLPVFGMKKGEGGFLAVISGCDAYAHVLAEVSGINTERNYVYARFRFKELDSFPLKDLSGKAQDYLVVDIKTRSLPAAGVQYQFLSGEEADYNGMADAYAAYLAEQKGLEPQEEQAAYVLELYGAVRKQKSVLGIPATVSERLTSFEQARAMLETLEQQGLGTPAVRYQYATGSRIKTRASGKMDILSLLGGRKGFEELVQYTQDKGGRVFLSVNTVLTKESLFGSGYVRNVMNLKAYQYSYSSLTGFQDTSTKACLLRPDAVFRTVEQLFRRAETSGTRDLALEALSSQLYSSFGEDYSSREDAKRLFEEALALAEKSNIRLMLEGAGAYALPYAAMAVDVPVQSNHYSIVDDDVPFYQLAVSRFVPCVSQPVNLTSNPKLQLLRCIQTGTIPQFAFVAGDPAVLQGTELERLFAADFEKWRPDVVRFVKDWQTAREAAGASRMVSFRVIQEGLTETSYENGTRVFVNTGASACLYNGLEIPAMSYRVLS